MGVFGFYHFLLQRYANLPASLIAHIELNVLNRSTGRRAVLLISMPLWFSGQYPVIGEICHSSDPIHYAIEAVIIVKYRWRTLSRFSLFTQYECKITAYLPFGIG